MAASLHTAVTSYKLLKHSEIHPLIVGKRVWLRPRVQERPSGEEVRFGRYFRATSANGSASGSFMVVLIGTWVMPGVGVDRRVHPSAAELFPVSARKKKPRTLELT